VRTDSTNGTFMAAVSIRPSAPAVIASGVPVGYVIVPEI
jgi:hypothetical protein